MQECLKKFCKKQMLWPKRLTHLCESNGSETGSSGEEERATHGRGTGSDGCLRGLSSGRGGAVAGGGGEASRGLDGGGAGDGDGLVDDGRDDGGDRGGDGLDRDHGARRGDASDARDGRGADGNGGAGDLDRGESAVVVLGRADAAHGADGGRDGDGLSDDNSRVSRAVGDTGGARGDGAGGGAEDGGGGHRVDGGGDRGAAGRAVGHGRGARGDGDIVSRVNGALGLVRLGQDGTSEGNGSIGETHLD
jgi:hypothetical protein